MDVRFTPHNLHLESPDLFAGQDPHLKVLNRQPLVYRFPLIDRLPTRLPGIYTISGGRQIGKTTLLKQWMAHLLQTGVPPRAIAFFTGELIDDQHALVRLISEHLQDVGGLQNGLRYLVLDEVTYTQFWDKGVKFLADSGALENVVLVLSGSDMAIIREARMRFPGRRGMADQVDFLLYPLSFSEFVRLGQALSPGEHQAALASELDAEAMDRLFAAFGAYLVHGGFLTAINAMAKDGHIPPAVFAVYSDWIRGDVLKRHKQEHYLRQVLQAVLRRMGSQVTWNALCQDLSIDHPQTVADYIGLLESMDVVYVQPALQKDKLLAAPKKARKVMFTDPFILHAVNAWLHPSQDPFRERLRPVLENPDDCGRIVEACAASHYRRHFPTFYIKAKGEVDIAYVNGRGFHPIEIKWTGQLRPADLKQVAKYPNSLILTKSRSSGRIQEIPTEPLPLHLLRLE
jgi:predicted AAA+ superfamily ATPase